MGLKDLITAAPALQEFGLLARGIEPIMTDPEVSRDEKRKILSQLVDNLSDKAFNNKIVIEQVFKIINMKEDECQKFWDEKSQTDFIIGWCPRLAQKRDELSKEVAKHRKQFKMKV